MAALMHRRMNGYLATVTGLKEPVSGWKVGWDLPRRGLFSFRLMGFVKLGSWVAFLYRRCLFGTKSHNCPARECEAYILNIERANRLIKGMEIVRAAG